MKRYVVGFAFDRYSNQVLLINRIAKNGYTEGYNGLGGKIEDNENRLQAMIREFKEESGLVCKNWLEIGRMYGENWECFIFFSFIPWEQIQKRVTEEGVIEWHSLDNIPYNSQDFTNIPWIISMVKDPNIRNGNIYLEIEYK